MKFKREFLIDELDLPRAAVEDQMVETSRWSIHHEIVFRHGDKFYSTSYSVGATECQDESPWDDEPEVECVEVRKVQKLVESWEPVGE